MSEVIPFPRPEAEPLWKWWCTWCGHELPKAPPGKAFEICPNCGNGARMSWPPEWPPSSPSDIVPQQ